MVSAAVVDRARGAILIEGRYDAQEYQRVGCRGENMRRDWTPAQRRRMRKRRNRLEKQIDMKVLERQINYCEIDGVPVPLDEI